MVWPFSRKTKSAPTPEPGKSELDEVTSLVRHLGYDLLPDGAAIALAQLWSDYSVAEAASHIVVVSFARDLSKAQETNDLDMMLKIAPLGLAILEVLKNLKDNGMMRPEVWRNDATAIGKMMTPGPEAIEWSRKVLSDPAIADIVLAKSRVL